MFLTLKKIIKKIKKNKHKSIKVSYTASLFKKGNKFCINKFLEEANELALEFKKRNKKRIINETVDTIYHLFVLLELNRINLSSIKKELNRRLKFSGIEEKKNRKKNVR
ncbi:HisI Phosphoribosyl-ATP pyrophosphohydrolase [Candidatus Pelagibacterales bacterium]